MYQHRDIDGAVIQLPTGKVVCIGRNYLDHIAELNNEVPSEPLLFMKPATAICDLTQPVTIPQGLGECHNELEIALLIKEPLKQADSSQVLNAVWGVGLGLDLTLRDVQSKLKQKGQPWERAKAFDNSCPLSSFVPLHQVEDVQDLAFTLTVNGDVRQQGHSALMIHKVAELVAHISTIFTLLPGDVVMTGTPKGVGALNVGDSIEVSLPPHLSAKTRVI